MKNNAPQKIRSCLKHKHCPKYFVDVLSSHLPTNYGTISNGLCAQLPISSRSAGKMIDMRDNNHGIDIAAGGSKLCIQRSHCDIASARDPPNRFLAFGSPHDAQN